MNRTIPLLMALTLACNRAEAPAAPPTTADGGDPARGRQLVAQYACNVCHVVPGTEGPQGALGPSLVGVASRATISLGTVPNTPENLRRFIQEPASMNPQSTMPPIGLPDADARDLAAFLMTLK
jgi:cytochrome c2